MYKLCLTLESLLVNSLSDQQAFSIDICPVWPQPVLNFQWTKCFPFRFRRKPVCGMFRSGAKWIEAVDKSLSNNKAHNISFKMLWLQLSCDHCICHDYLVGKVAAYEFFSLLRFYIAFQLCKGDYQHVISEFKYISIVFIASRVSIDCCRYL